MNPIPIPHPVMPDLIRHPASSWTAAGSGTPDQVWGDTKGIFERSCWAKFLRILPFALIPFGGPIFAEPLPRISPDQVGIVYQQCLARAAVNASRTDLPDEQIYPAAYQTCIPTRIELQNRVSNVVEGEAKLKAIEAEAASTFAERTKKIRERRREFEAQLPKDKNAPNQ